MAPTQRLPGAAQALRRGLYGRCPACGEGRMFRAFLKVADICPHCSEELHHHRADDFPAYLVIVIVGHILVPIVLAVKTEIAPAVWISMFEILFGWCHGARQTGAFSLKCGNRSLNSDPG